MNRLFPDLTITVLDTITAFDVADGSYLYTLDELQSASIAQSQDKVDITGKQGRKLNSLKRNKAVTISASNGLVSGGLLASQTGGTFEQKATTVRYYDYLTVSNNAATTTYKAIGTVGAEICELFVKNTNGTAGESLKQDTSVGAKTFTYDASSKALAFNDSEIDDGTEIVVIYDRKIDGAVLANYSDTYSGKASLYIDCTCEDTCGNEYHGQFYIPKADFDGNFTFEMGDNQTVHSFEAEALAGACGTGGLYWTFTVFGVGTEDAE